MKAAGQYKENTMPTMKNRNPDPMLSAAIDEPTTTVPTSTIPAAPSVDAPSFPRPKSTSFTKDSPAFKSAVESTTNIEKTPDPMKQEKFKGHAY